MILHIDMDAFFASIEQAINPRLKNKPLIVGSRNNKLRTVVCAASYEAKHYGIHSGMSSQDAFKLCPNLEFVPADQSKYIWTSEEILKLVKTYGYETLYASIDEFQLDVKNTPNPKILAEIIQKQIRETFHIGLSIGISKNRILAKLASKLDKPNGITLIDENNLIETLQKTPVEKLCGVGPKTQIILHKLGINSCLDLYQKPDKFLEQFFGKNGNYLYVSLHGDENLEIETASQAKSIGHSYTLNKATRNPGFIKAWFRLLAEAVGSRLRQNNLVAHTIHIYIGGEQMANFSIQKTYKEATCDGYDIYLRALKIYPDIAQKTPQIRALGLTCSSLAQNNYPPLFEKQKRGEALTKTLDKINAKFGSNTIYPAVITLTKE